MSRSMINKRRPYLLLIFIAILCLFLLKGFSLTESADTAENLIELMKKEYKPVEPLLPPGVDVMKGFKEGEGPILGNIQASQGKAYVVHKGRRSAYLLKKGHPLFPGDLLVTGIRSRISVKLNDKSVFTLASNSKMTVDESVYDPKKDARTSVIGLLFGRVRFIVSKIKGKSTYRVKTPTAVCGVRGSDFALAVIPEKIKLSSGKKGLSRLAIVSRAHAQVPDLMTILVTGPGTSVTFAGTVGPAMAVGPTSVTAAAAGAAAMSPAVVGAAAALGALNAIGPGLASLSMPPQ
ncbi:MAG: FecR domain-containing protein [Deltaproteobacteria bacterium]|nr:FecR domain-containing protein [Deltaproteobacteria bacterium]MBW2138042.1 FecR domain-containing protein [Deltaproteobacteria bacterium]